MDHFLQVISVQGDSITLPADRVAGGMYIANQPTPAKALTVSEIRLHSTRIRVPVRFRIDSFLLRAAGPSSLDGDAASSRLDSSMS